MHWYLFSDIIGEKVYGYANRTRVEKGRRIYFVSKL